MLRIALQMGHKDYVGFAIAYNIHPIITRGLQSLTIHIQELQEAYNRLQYIYKNYAHLQLFIIGPQELQDAYKHL